ncbi:glycoside hydrolase family 27 protein [Sphingomonas sp. BT-65]|uniref:glycoside hydrolase family 27 protein n=1 Tax=Sphingomonas sp. BT-65 TaxID=2989821 RepID=UPI0022355C6A|nr:glycoside hydrolase family 27 protein [Sphingomonas sp. BT-65]MCW4461985.1 glycoside hydrolase family 27 protein [Sphingomonas sp. BT-65]
MLDRRDFLAVPALLGLAAASPALAIRRGMRAADSRLRAPAPPMGWNSWNSFATTLTEAQALETARIMAEKLLPFGYDVFTVDIQWYEPNATGYAYRAGAELAMDGYGRLQPAPNRFPSAAAGKGFGPLADRIHALGLKFGVHLMRGIPRLAYARDLPVLGTRHSARDIANPNSVCTWNTDMYGVDMSKPGAQAYYDSVFALFAQWGVDFVKMDDMSRPYANNWAEIEAAQAAIAASGRPMVLSLSPGETDLKWGVHAQQHAQMWRISDDFWDEWPLLKDQFRRLEAWNPYRRPGAWPDADMLPLGLLAMGSRKTKFTPDEQQTLMTLWAIARSPLIMGGDLRGLDAATLKLLTNREVIALNQTSRDNMPVSNDGARVVWTAQTADGTARYLALFNLSDHPLVVEQKFKAIGAPRKAKALNLWTGEAGDVDTELAIELRGHASALFKLS